MKQLKFGLVATAVLAWTLAASAQDSKPANSHSNQKSQMAALAGDASTDPLAAGTSTSASSGSPEAPAATKLGAVSSTAPAAPTNAELAAKYAKLNAWDFDSLRYPGAENTILQESLGLRPELLKHNIGFVFMEIGAVNYNALNPPMYGANGPDANGAYHPATAGTKQQYAGQRPTGYNNSYWYVTKNFGDNTQLELCAEDVWTTFLPTAYTDDVKFCALELNQYLFNRRVKILAGYMQDTDEFWGMYTAGNMAGSLLGALAVIPGEVGEATMKNLAPQLIVRVNVTKNVYSASAIQRSANPVYGSADTHDPFYLPFGIKGAKAFLTEEIGYKRAAEPGVRQVWARLDGFYNFSHYADYRTYNFTNYWLGKGGPTYGMTKNNFAVYSAVDYQLVHEGARPSSGLYVGGVASYAPPQQNIYTQYYEFRAYYPGVNQKRPYDMFTFTVDDYAFSRQGISMNEGFSFERPLVAGHGTEPAFLKAGSASTNQLNITTSYVVHASHGMWLNFALDWIDHPTPTPKTPNALVLQTGWAMFF